MPGFHSLVRSAARRGTALAAGFNSRLLFCNSAKGCSKMPGCKAPEVPNREAYWMYVERRGTRETPQAGVF